MSADARLADTALQVGPRLRDLRKTKGMSLVTLSGLADLSIGMLSQIERGLSNPSLASLSRIAQALGVAAVELFDARPELAPEDTAPLIQRGAERSHLLFDQLGLTKEIISPARSRQLELILVKLEPDGRSSDGPYTHDGEEAGLVLEGRLALHVGDECYQLDVGDSFQFQSHRPHWFRNIHPGITQVIWAIATAPPDSGHSTKT